MRSLANNFWLGGLTTEDDNKTNPRCKLCEKMKSASISEQLGDLSRYICCVLLTIEVDLIKLSFGHVLAQKYVGSFCSTGMYNLHFDLKSLIYSFTCSP